MKKTTLLLFTSLFSIMLIAQETEKVFNPKVSGYVSYEAFFDTYQSVDTRDGDVYLYPLPANLDVNGDDINENLQFRMLSIQSRLKFSSTGPDAFGAKTSAVIEGDFLGISQNDVRQIRLRNAFMKLDWGTTKLILGQFWHPTIYTKNIPKVIHFGAAAPFHPLHRSPQARLTLNPSENLEILAAALVHGYHISSGPATAQRNAGIPDLQFRGIFKTDVIYMGLNAGYKILKPRLITNAGVKTDKTIGSYNLHAFGGLNMDPINISGGLLYGQNLTHFVMIGGYASSDLTDDYDYTNYKTMSLYADAYIKMDNMQIGGFFGYSKNMGADDDITNLIAYGRSTSLSHIFRIAPRFVVTSGKTSFAFEYNLTGAVYGTAFDSKGKPTSTADAVINNKIMFSAKYAF
jgi:hypothetical protein